MLFVPKQVQLQSHGFGQGTSSESCLNKILVEDLSSNSFLKSLKHAGFPPHNLLSQQKG